MSTYEFIPNKSSVEVLEIAPKTFISLNTFNSEFSYI